MKKFLPFLTALCLLFGSAGVMQGQAPEIVSFSPDTNAIDVPLDVELQLEFDIDIIFNTDPEIVKRIKVYETNSPSNVVFNVFMFGGDVFSSDIHINVDTLFINLENSSLSPETEYSVIIEEGAIESAADSTGFAGIDDINTRWRFTTVSRPGLSSKSPVNDATGVTGLETLTLTFDEAINSGTNKNLYIYKDGGTLFQTINTTDDAGLITISGSDHDVNISHDAFNGNQGFYIDVDEGFVTSQSTGVGSAAIDGATEWSFTVSFGARPRPVFLRPICRSLPSMPMPPLSSDTTSLSPLPVIKMLSYTTTAVPYFKLLTPPPMPVFFPTTASIINLPLVTTISRATPPST
ncbi:Ig-like domain-containing protein [Anaerophaga thermohalophila]|uniref:Ig-like domain-containing protein n=1 Tax=Anaerophaga thermohalophila TaxID=177400 RepID=UPI000237BCED|nr:Ig-like domain-containing protein [Anaerophaga thermohalophila]